VLWSAAVMVAALTSLVFDVAFDASDPLVSNDVAKVLGLSARGANADQLPRTLTGHPVAKARSTAHKSDLSGASTAEWGR
jgi:hypothetical protein